MRAPTRDRLPLIFNGARSFALHFGLLKIGIAIVTEYWFSSEQWQGDFAALVAFYFQRFLGLLQSARRRIFRG